MSADRELEMENFFPALGMLFFLVAASIVAVLVGVLLIVIWRSRGKTWRATIWAAVVGAAICEAILCMICVGGVLAVLGGFAHFTSVPPNDLIGTYEAKYPSDSWPVVKEVLVLRKDGTFDQTITRADGPSLHSSGRWSADCDFWGTDIHLGNALRPIDGFGTPCAKPQRTNEILGAQKVLGKVSISIERELDISYWKVPASTSKADKRK
jgi:hypothetical protein